MEQNHLTLWRGNLLTVIGIRWISCTIKRFKISRVTVLRRRIAAGLKPVYPL